MDTKSLHILHVVASLQGGAAHHVLHLSQGLLKEGATVSVAAPTDNAALKLQFDFSGCLMHEVAMDGSWPFKATRQLKKLYRKEPFTHIHVHGVRAAYLGRRAWSNGDSPVIYTVHGYHPAYYTSAFRRKAADQSERKFASKTAAYIAVSNHTKEDLLSAVPDAKNRCRVISNAIPSQRLDDEEARLAGNKIRREMGIEKGQFVMGTLARLHWQKGIDRLLESQKRLLDQGSQQVLIIAGDGPDRQELEEQAQKLGIEHSVKFLGHRDKAYNLYAAMDVFVLPSLWEGLPLTVLEAWDAGTPVVVTDVPGNRDLVKHNQTGLCVQPTADALAQAITKIRKDNNLSKKLIQKGRKNLEENFSLDSMIEQNIKVYQETSSLR